MRKFKVLSTKGLNPLLVEKATENGIAIIKQDAIRIRTIQTKEKWDEITRVLQSTFSYAVFTSSNGVDAVKKYLSNYVNYLPVQWKIFCISGRTRELLEKDSELFGSIEGTAPNGVELAAVILNSGVKDLLFFSGNRRRDELPSILQAAGVQVHEVVVYETINTPVKAPEEVDGVMFFSPSAVESFFSVNQLKENTVCFAIGSTTAASLELFTKNKVYSSKEPTQEALLNHVIDYFKNR